MKIKTDAKLEEIETRLDGCSNLLHLLCEIAETSCISEKTMSAVCDLLDSIRNDFTEIINAEEVCS